MAFFSIFSSLYSPVLLECSSKLDIESIYFSPLSYSHILQINTLLQQCMAKKIKNPKLQSKNQTPQSQEKQSQKSAFTTFSQKIQKAKERKMEKLQDTKSRLMGQKQADQSHKVTNKFAKVTKASKFALLDDNEDAYKPSNRLTHKGTTMDQVKHFNDMHFDNDEGEGYSGMDDELHAQANFHGFENNEQEEAPANPNHRKSKNEIYKQIIQKSKQHKRDRQEQYEQNFNAAVELDQQFDTFVQGLKFRNNDAKIRDKIKSTDVEYERLMNELKEEERVVANRVVDNDKKGAEKLRKRKNVQINELMRDSDGEEEDVRGWVKGIGEHQEHDQHQEDQEDQDDDNDQEGGSEDSEENDEIDDVQLSSGDEDDDEEGENDEQEQEHSKEDKIIIKSGSEEEEEDQEDDEQQEEEEEEEEEQWQQKSEEPQKNRKKAAGMFKKTPQPTKHKQITKQKPQQGPKRRH